jgi:tetratricopeptide (TPR) repeat protein
MALRIMDEVVAQNPTNPEAFGRKAQLLYNSNRVDEAETTLQRALEINPNYPFGHLLRGFFRQNEGETAGALLLFRKAAELYDPEARDHLGQVYALIGDSEFKMNRPVAARVALQLALRHQPGSQELRQHFDHLMGDQSPLPACARQEYRFQSLPADAPEARKQAWNKALSSAATGKLSDAAAAFEGLTREDDGNAAAWYNLGLVRAWLGDNRRAIEALDQYVTLESDDERAGAAWCLAEVLRSGQGMDEQANYIEHSLAFQIRDPKTIAAMLNEWQTKRRMIGAQANEEGTFLTALILERGPAVTGALVSSFAPGAGAYLMIVGEMLRLWNTSRDALERVYEEVLQRAGPALSSPRRDEMPAPFNEVTLEALVFPVHTTDNAAANRLVADHYQQFFEDKWIHRPLRSLNQIPPIDAAGHANLRKKLLGAVQFVQDCSPHAASAYDFNRLRRKLGLLKGEAAVSAGGLDISAMSAAELAGLKPEALADDLLEQAYQTAVKLDAHELAVGFARSLVARPPQAGRADRYPVYAYLMQRAQGDGDTTAALDILNEGEKVDCEHNEGRRRNDYELRRAQLHAKRGDTAEAENGFERLIERAPSELRYRTSAAEAMISTNQAASALRFAEGGLAKAREQNNRDAEGHFLELVAAAKRRLGS